MVSPSDLRGAAQRLRNQLPQRQHNKPPAETGQRLATIARSNDEELRVNWCEYEGKPYLSLHLWNRDRDGQWWPDGKRGMSVRIRELPDLAEAIAEALGLAAESLNRSRPGGRPSHAQPSPRVDPQRQRSDARGAAPQPPWAIGQAEAFDEFQEGADSH